MTDHDDHIATAIHATYSGLLTTATAHTRIDQLEQRLHRLNSRIRDLALTAGAALAIAIAGLIVQEVTR
jgi:hypothetical protein